MRFTASSFCANIRYHILIFVKVVSHMSGIDSIRNYRLSSRMKQVIFSVLFWGVIAHLYMYMNRIVNHDAVYALRSSGSSIASGRWLIYILDEIAYKFHNHYNTPWGIGAATLLIYAVCACILVKTFDIRSKPLCFLLGAVLVTHPTVTSNNLYIFTAHYYAFSFLLACGSVLLIRTSGKPIAVLGSSLLIACSLGIYQAYLPFVLCLYVLLILLNCLHAEAQTADIIKMALRFLAALLGGLILYFVIHRCFLRLTGTQMNAYMGLETMGKLELSSIPAILKNCYSSFFGLFLENYHGINHKPWLRILMLLCCLFTLGSVLLLILRNRIRPMHIFFVCIAFILFPVAIGAIYIMTQAENAVCTMTVYSTVFVFLAPICAADRLARDLTVNKAFVVEMALCAALVFVPVYYSSLANEAYLSLEYTNQNINAYFTELAAQIKSLDGFSTDLDVALIGENQDETLPQLEFDYILRGTFSPARLINEYSREDFMTMHCGYSCTFVEDTQALAEDDRVKAMPAYPSDGSICIIDDVIVVKFS